MKRYRSNDAEEHHPSEVTTLYPGLQVTTLRAVFRSRPQREALRQLASAVYASRTALTDPTDAVLIGRATARMLRCESVSPSNGGLPALVHGAAECQQVLIWSAERCRPR